MPIPGIERVTEINILGVIFKNDLSMEGHVDHLLSSCGSSLYALSLLRAHGMQVEELQEVFRSKVLSRLMYASQAWWGFAQSHRNAGMETTSHTINRIQAFINKCKRFGYCSQSCEPFITLCEQADDNLFKQIIINDNHVLHHLIPKTKTHDHYVRIRSHNFQLPIKDNRNFINRCLFKGII